MYDLDSRRQKFDLLNRCRILIEFDTAEMRRMNRALAKGFISRTISVYVRRNVCTLFCRPLQNNNVK